MPEQIQGVTRVTLFQTHVCQPERQRRERLSSSLCSRCIQDLKHRLETGCGSLESDRHFFWEPLLRSGSQQFLFPDAHSPLIIAVCFHVVTLEEIIDRETDKGL